ncbi:SDR family NAD(P)-dependent oxidoreductase [Leptolyngbyaceae cyanobacterium CCMR0082]|uniref:SDR family NAD(P)-dependent oxidoreductase n=1 Tax=Adonisia turfae CCMR0082 TaxID=2304604 RepID=A0A6M0S6A0_9CYAN|nr:SDR family NAD(P)-dependent oxidoreductase [Adonisia turfae]NEZ63613.1 SDR family NAD(P)-dependent oxidoreductase [Adonisia turfae CCMR0082]
MNDLLNNSPELVSLLSTYFSQRGKFLAKVINADLKSSPLKSSRQLVEVAQLADIESFKSLEESADVSVSTDTELDDLSSPNTQPLAQTIEKLLIDLIVEQTGYPAESITLEARLLDDLNLDSIKSAEVVAQTAKQIGLEGQVDPSLFANATLNEVVEALQEIQITGNTGTQHFLGATVNTTIQKDPWVRNYLIEYVAESAEQINEFDQLKHKFPVDDLVKSEILIVASSQNRDWAEGLAEELQHKGAQTAIADLMQLQQLYGHDYTHIISILPRETEAAPAAKLEKAITQLRTIGAFPEERSDGDYTSVSYIQFGGGHFGKENNVAAIDTSCTIGFAASLHLERTDLKVRAIDLPLDAESDLLIRAVIEEIVRPDTYLAVGFDSECIRYIPRPCLQDRSTYQDRNILWSNEDVVLVTGGAKGITAECALAWAKQTGVSLALVGSSAHPQDSPTGKSAVEISETLSRFQASGLTCHYYQCDVSDKASLNDLVMVIQEELGTITGVIHGAAVNRAKPVNKSTVEDALSEVKPKIMGALNLSEIFQQETLKLFAGFSSIGAVIGLPGNTWYSFSNEALDLILRDYKQQHPTTEIISIAYSVWSEVGMGAKMGAVSGLSRMGIGAISLQEGVDRFVQLMEQNPGNSQVVIAARIDGRISRQHNFDTWLPPRNSPPQNFKFLEQILMSEPGVETIVRAHLNMTKDSYVLDHIYNGSYLFPTVFGLEAMAQTVAYTLGIDSFTSFRLEDVRLERPIVVHPENGVDIEIHAEVSERVEESESLRIYVEIKTESTGFARAHFAANFVLDKTIELKTYKVPQRLVPLDIEPKKDLYGWLLFQGEKFQRIQEIYSLDSHKMVFLTEQKGSNRENSSDRADGPFLIGDPYYRDSLLHSVQPMVPEDLCLPLGIDSIEIHLNKKQFENYFIGITLRNNTENDQHDTSVIVVNRNGEVIEKLEGYNVKIMEHRSENPTAEELVSPQVRDGQLLYQELNERAQALGVEAPEATLAHLSGLHHLPTQERHQLELPLFFETLHKLLHKLE